jgi:hypothetical protein
LWLFNIGDLLKIRSRKPKAPWTASAWSGQRVYSGIFVQGILSDNQIMSLLYSYYVSVIYLHVIKQVYLYDSQHENEL